MAEMLPSARAMLFTGPTDRPADWDGTLLDRVREYLDLPAERRPDCWIETTSPVRFADGLRPRTHLDARMIDELASLLARQGLL